MDNSARFASNADVDLFGTDAAMAAGGAPKPSRLVLSQTSTPPTQIVFIEAKAPDALDLLSGVQPAVEAVLLDRVQDGVQQSPPAWPATTSGAWPASTP